jgi:hypothetical protein
MKPTLIRYKTRPETTEENQRLIENVFRELKANSIDDFRHVVLKLGDGSFLHFSRQRTAPAPWRGSKLFSCPRPVSETAVSSRHK